jgi:hypothetical protein
MKPTAGISGWIQLRKAGWTTTQLLRLCYFRSIYVPTALDQAPLDIRRLEFARWLVVTGRLTS